MKLRLLVFLLLLLESNSILGQDLAHQFGPKTAISESCSPVPYSDEYTLYDIDQDGLEDKLFNCAWWSRNLGDGNFDEISHLIYNGGFTPILNCFDMNFDGVLEYVRYDNNFGIQLFNLNPAYFQEGASYSEHYAQNETTIPLGDEMLANWYESLVIFKSIIIPTDYDGDGLGDIIVARVAINDFVGSVTGLLEVIWAKQEAPNEFGNWQLLHAEGFLSEEVLYAELEFLVEDFNQDGLTDFYIKADTEFSIHINDAEGEYLYILPSGINSTGTNSYVHGEAAFKDLDADGDLDFVLENTDFWNNNWSITWHENVANESDSLIFAAEEYILKLDEDFAIIGIANILHEDFNNDGILDVVHHYRTESCYGCPAENSFRYYVGLDTHTFCEPVKLNTESVGFPSFVSTCDIDGDEDLDIRFAANSNGYYFENLPNNENVAAFEFELNCSNKIELKNLSGLQYNPSTYFNWIFEGIIFSLDRYPESFIAEVPDTGQYELSLALCDSLSCDTATQIVQINHLSDFEVPETTFTNYPTQFHNESKGFTSFSWIFGDGNVSVEKSPTHNYDIPGTYVVELFMTDSTMVDCTAQYASEITVEQGSAIESYGTKQWAYPNPTSNQLTIELPNDFSNWRLLDVNGKLLKEGKETKLDLASFRAGIYFLETHFGVQKVLLIKQ